MIDANEILKKIVSDIKKERVKPKTVKVSEIEAKELASHFRETSFHIKQNYTDNKILQAMKNGEFSVYGTKLEIA